MTSNRESRTVLVVVLAVAAGVIGVNVLVNPGGLPGGMGVVALILALLAAGIWALSWRESVAAKAYHEPESEPVVTPIAPSKPVAALPAAVHTPIVVEAAIPDMKTETVVIQAAPVFEFVAPEPEPAVEVVIGDAPIVDEPVAVAEPMRSPVPVVEPDRSPTPISDPKPTPEPIGDPKPTPEPIGDPEPKPAIEAVIGDAPVVDDPTPIVEEIAAVAPTTPASEVQADTVVQDAAAAPETPPNPKPMPSDAPETKDVPQPVPSADSPPPPVYEGEGVRESDQLDELTKIEGIGPYYRDALHKLGIMTFAQLAQETDAKALVERLKANGFRQHPTIPTWAEQAALAAAGDWEALTALQSNLTTGRRTEG